MVKFDKLPRGISTVRCANEARKEKVCRLRGDPSGEYMVKSNDSQKLHTASSGT